MHLQKEGRRQAFIQCNNVRTKRHPLPNPLFYLRVANPTSGMNLQNGNHVAHCFSIPPQTTCCHVGGRRLLRHWMCRPLQSIAAINARLDAVHCLMQRCELAEEFRGHLLQVRDLERLLGCVRNSSAPPSEGIPNWAIKAAQAKWVFNSCLRHSTKDCLLQRIKPKEVYYDTSDSLID